MAELLVMAKNNWMVDADKIGWTAEKIIKADKQYKIGDIVQVFPDGKLSDYAHADGKFYVLRVEGLSFEDALKYQEQWNEEYLVEGKTQQRMLKRRKFNIDLVSLPKEVLDKLNKDYVANISIKDIPTFIYDKVNIESITLTTKIE